MAKNNNYCTNEKMDSLGNAVRPRLDKSELGWKFSVAAPLVEGVVIVTACGTAAVLPFPAVPLWASLVFGKEYKPAKEAPAGIGLAATPANNFR